MDVAAAVHRGEHPEREGDRRRGRPVAASRTAPRRARSRATRCRRRARAGSAEPRRPGRGTRRRTRAGAPGRRRRRTRAPPRSVRGRRSRCGRGAAGRHGGVVMVVSGSRARSRDCRRTPARTPCSQASGLGLRRRGGGAAARTLVDGDEAHLHLAHGDRVAVLKRGLRDPCAVDAHAVEAAVVPQDDLLARRVTTAWRRETERSSSTTSEAVPRPKRRLPSPTGSRRPRRRPRSRGSGRGQAVLRSGRRAAVALGDGGAPPTCVGASETV